jgi:thioredoxin reductase (NADPH)
MARTVVTDADVVVVGGGVAGLSAGIYLQRYGLRTLILDKGKARSVWIQELHNYLGLPPDTPGRTLLLQGRRHFQDLGGEYRNGFVEAVEEQDGHFVVRVKRGRQNSRYETMHARYLIAASGIIDHLPQLESMQNVYDYAGYSLHVCLLCDGYEMRGLRAGLFAGRVEDVAIAEKLSWFTPRITVFTHGLFELLPEQRQWLRQQGWELEETPIRAFQGRDHQVEAVELIDGRRRAIETGMFALGARYHADYLSGFDLMRERGYLVTDAQGRTSHPRIFAPGDLSLGINQAIVA